VNILVSNDDGPQAIGLEVLRASIRKAFPRSKVVTVVPNLAQGGQGLSITPRAAEDISVERIQRDFYVVEGKPADGIYITLGNPRRFLSRGRFDLVITGVNHGQNVGMDVFHSGTVGMAMLASAFFGVRAMAFSQELGASGCIDASTFRTASKYLPSFLKDAARQKIYCHTVNFPFKEPNGQRLCGVSMYSRFRPHLAVKNRRQGEDVAQLENGYITISLLQPNALSGNGYADASAKLDVDYSHHAL
jgi:5'/3'-nucleotidase SurE